MSEHSHTDEHAHGEHAGLTKKKIFEVLGILVLITAIEFIIALWAIPGKHMSQHIGNYVYIALTLLKAFYIVAYFMHLKFEKVGLQVVLSVSFIFIFYFIVLMLIEGGYLHLHMPLV
ncbi:cytochrome C oxidase subunit IV family protein [Pedobacter sp. MC2016-24]|uniref:cytochrome C oxidase subunit IV family protein n=1 Tax=Pedobacter sp. MC2016-24 TaxID=2780090 RepID=UPI00187DF9DD|nr:cytochrome C oxidase subunit IV family protein [Pedobacter sp. MC2016-24]MBE9598955.1 cytochrome C oxidase subunit IV family protein [Pedobacter sp. MC2016-24]